MAEEPTPAAEAAARAGPPTSTVAQGGFGAGAALAWAAVCVPIAWGVYETLAKAAILLK